MHRGQQQQLKIVNAMCLPKVEQIPFDGDPLRYWLFSQQFDNNVDVNDVDDRTNLLILFQYCIGNARRAIECNVVQLLWRPVRVIVGPDSC